MTKRMLIDASHPEETRVVVMDGNRLEEFDVETPDRRPLKGNIYLAKIVRVEPSLQAAFVEYGGNRHGFLAFGEIHPDYYQIPVADRQRLLEAQAAEAEEAAREDEIETAAERLAPEDDGDLAAPAGPAPLPETPGETLGEDGAPVPDLLPDPAEEAPADEAPAPRAAPLAMRVERVVEGDAPAGDGEAGEGEAGEGEAGEVPGEETAEAEARAEAAPPPETLGGENGRERDEDERGRRVPARYLRHYKIQEVIRRRQVILVQVVKEERGSKGAALTTYVSLAGRFSVLMPNSPKGGGVSRKISSAGDRKRLREVIEELGLPRGMGIIVRTAGAQRPKPEIRRDCEYLLRLWDGIRERTLASTAPALVYEEADLLKRCIRDNFNREIEEVQVEGEEAFRQARDFMRMLMPQHERKVRLYRDAALPLFARAGAEAQLDAMMQPVVQLRSGGSLVINQTEALVAIDVNSGRATRDRHIEDTALRTNLEAADEIARQLRLRDLAGLVVIDFIDMESSRHDAMVERRLKDALHQDRARIQVGRISHFGLLEMSRQRLRPSLTEHAFVTCPHCQGLGIVRSPESAALAVLRAAEEEGARRRGCELLLRCAPSVALHLLNRKRERLAELEARHGVLLVLEPDAALQGAENRIERVRALAPSEGPAAAPALRMDYAPRTEAEEPAEEEEAAEAPESGPEAEPGAAPARRAEGEEGGRRRRRRRRGRREDGSPEEGAAEEGEEEPAAEAAGEEASAAAPGEPAEASREEGRDEGREEGEGRRRRGRRGGRRRREEEGEAAAEATAAAEPVAQALRPALRPAPRYAGPTPADPFAGAYDPFLDAMTAAEEAELSRGRAAPPAPVPPIEGRAAEPPASAAEAPSGAVPERVVSGEAPRASLAEAAPAPVPAPLPDETEEAAAPAASDPAEPRAARAVGAGSGAPEPGRAGVAPAAASPGPELAGPVAAPPVRPVVIGADGGEAQPARRGWWRR